MSSGGRTTRCLLALACASCSATLAGTAHASLTDNAAIAAAASSAAAAWTFGWIGTAIGLSTLMAAIGAAFFAKRAAEETKKSADVALRSERSWVTFEPPLLQKYSRDHHDPGIFKLEFELKIDNMGERPASDFFIRTRLLCYDYRESGAPIDAFIAESKALAPKLGGIFLRPGESRSELITESVGRDGIDALRAVILIIFVGYKNRPVRDEFRFTTSTFQFALNDPVAPGAEILFDDEKRETITLMRAGEWDRMA